jgi:UDPglucose 6-dehydrogenase
MMKVCVFGLWHLGCVTAACLAQAGHQVVALDADPDVIDSLRQGKPPLFEPGLEELIKSGMETGRLRFENDPAVVADAEVTWVTFDTPVGDDDVPQPSIVVDHVRSLFKYLPAGMLVLVSSQLPVGTTRHLADSAAGRGCELVTFGYSPENLRLGRALDVFMKPDRIVVGLETERDREKVVALLAPITDRIEWMGLESAEMTKHAINAFLATSVAFMNEVAAICEDVGANAKDVERGLKSEERIGRKAYLSPGGAFAGGTLARDVTILADLGRRGGIPVTLVSSVADSNNQHRSWPLRKLKERLGNLRGRRIAILGLTYKAGTSTLRRSSAVELALELHSAGAEVVGFDPEVHKLPQELERRMALAGSASEALVQADAIVLATAWPQFRDLAWSGLISSMRHPIVVDANWFLAGALGSGGGVAYACVGLPWSTGMIR